EDQAGKSFHRITWRPPFAYDISIYVSPFYSFYEDQSHFFSKSQQLVYLEDISIDRRFTRYEETNISIALDPSASAEKYLHLFMQRTGKMEPYPAMGDQFLVHAMAPLVVENENGIAFTHCVAWEFMLDDHTFAEWSIPVDVSRLMNMKYYSAKERRAYNPLAWNNPLVAQFCSSNTSIARSEKPSNISVDISLDQVSLEWMRLTKAVVAIAGESEADLLEFVRLAMVRLAGCCRNTAALVVALLVARFVTELWARGSSVAAYSNRIYSLSLASSLFDFLSLLLGAVALPKKTGVSKDLDTGLLSLRLALVYLGLLRLVCSGLQSRKSAVSRLGKKGVVWHMRVAVSMLLAVLAAYVLLTGAKCYLCVYAAQALLGSASVVLQIPGGLVCCGLLLFAWTFDAALLMNVIGHGSQAMPLDVYWPLILPG
ncbi:hypothetical protein FB639_003670, partial [Coemansia asiatica]